MEAIEFKKALEKIKANSPKRNFKQLYDLIINLKPIDLKKPENQVDLFVSLKHSKGKSTKICALSGPELADSAKASCDKVILSDDFAKYRDDKKELKRLAKQYDFFIAQANLMAEVAKVFGRVLGTRGKMPNPKAGCVVPPNANLKPLVEKLQNSVRLFAKTQLSIKCIAGNQDMPDEQVLHNINTIYNAAIQALPNQEDSVKNVMLKLTMGPPVKIGEKEAEKENK